MKYFLISLGGVLGANARFLLGGWIVQKTAEKTAFPWGTFLVNVSGCFLLGLFMALSERFAWNPNWRFLVAVGFLGAYTTFSTFEYESIRLLIEGQTAIALRNMLGSTLFGLLSVWLGILCVRLFSE